jgi:glycosyltransferase involved in cell wall biosynthesis
MKVLNIMFGRARGGLEQAAIDYAEALRHASIHTLNITSPHAWVNPQLDALGLPHVSLQQFGNWDPFASMKLRAIATAEGADVAICHGNRALRIALRAFRHTPVRVVAVTHNYSIAAIAKADAAMTITRDLALEAELAGIPREAVFHIPNMVRIPENARAHTLYQHVPVFGAMGRFVRKKGFDVYLEAIAELNKRGLRFQAILGGAGEEEAHLHALAESLGITHTLRFSGWVESKEAFFQNIDFFVLPSHHEPFGIVLIEAMAHGIPSISTASEGPSEIIHHERDGLLVAKNDPVALADAMERFIREHTLAAGIANHGLQTVIERYSMDAMARRLGNALQKLPSKNTTNIAA